MSHWQYTPHLKPLLATSAATLLLLIYVWRRRRTPGAKPLAALVLSAGIWSLANALKLGATLLPAKLFWANVVYLGVVIAPVAWLLFALAYTGRERWLTRRRIFTLSLIPLLTVVLVWTDDLHGLMRRTVALDTPGPQPIMTNVHGPWFWVHSAYSYLLLLLGTAILLRTLWYRRRLYTRQVVAMALAALLPWAGNAANMLDTSPFRRLDPTPITFALSGMLLAWALFRYRLLDVVPVARDTVIDTMDDGVLVLDHDRRIVDYNPTASRLLDGALTNETIGRPAKEVLPVLADLIADCYTMPETTVDLRYRPDGDERYYRLHVTTIGGDGDAPAGRLVLVRDISDWVEKTRALQEQEQRFRSLVQNASDVITVVSPEGCIQYVSGSVQRILGYAPADLVGTIAVDLVHPEDRSSVIESFSELLETSCNDATSRFRFQHGDGSWRELEATGSNQLDNPAVAGIVLNARDVTERVRAERAVRRRAEELAALHDISLDVTQLDDPDRVLEAIVTRATELLEATSGSLCLYDQGENVQVTRFVGHNLPSEYPRLTVQYDGLPPSRLTNGATDRTPAAEELFTAVLSAPLIRQEETVGTLNVFREEGHFTEQELHLLSLFADQAAIAVENSRLYAQVERLATTDELTGLHNRRHFFELAKREFHRARRQGQPVSAIMLDIDRFKDVNDTHGHTVGDDVLRTVARRLKQNVREIDILGRYGGEEFVVLLPDTGRDTARQVAHRLRATVDDQPIATARAGEIRVTLSAGVAEATEEISDPMALVDQADAALYAAKAAGRNCVRVH